MLAIIDLSIRRDMIFMYRAFKFRMMPNDEQRVLINKTFGSSRFVYNYYLDKVKNNKYINPYSNIADYVNHTKYEYPFLREVDSNVIRKSIFSLDDNIKSCYNNNFGYPKFKSKYDKAVMQLVLFMENTKIKHIVILN